MRRVPIEQPPTLADALYAAEGLTPILEQQIHIAAGLMQMPIEQVRSGAKPLLSERSVRPLVAASRRGGQPISVVRKRRRPSS